MANETELAELLIEIAQALDESHATVNALTEKVNNLIKTVDGLNARIKKLESNDTFDIFKDDSSKKKPSPWPLPPVSPWPTPLPWKAVDRCQVCGIEWGNGSWGYACNQVNCPSRGISWSTTSPQLSSTCACGQNVTCQCNK